MTCRPTDVRKSCVIKKLVYDATFQEKKGIGTDIGNIIPIITSQYRQPQVSRYHRKKKKKNVFSCYIMKANAVYYHLFLCSLENSENHCQSIQGIYYVIITTTFYHVIIDVIITRQKKKKKSKVCRNYEKKSPDNRSCHHEKVGKKSCFILSRYYMKI